MAMRLGALYRLAVAACVLAAPSAAYSSETFRPCPTCPWMVEVPSPAGPPLLFSRAEITFDDWTACAADGACAAKLDDHGWGRGARPAINVTWHDAVAYAQWLSAASGLSCRLPSEAEWELAARGGTATAFWWGEDKGRAMANCRDCLPAPPYGTSPAGSFPANPFGLWDMNGNVWEWTADCWPQADADACVQRVIKGGSWYYYSRNMRPEARAGNHAVSGSYNIGIRVACDKRAD